jgi:hypothetical protein
MDFGAVLLRLCNAHKREQYLVQDRAEMPEALPPSARLPVAGLASLMEVAVYGGEVDVNHVAMMRKQE